MGKYRRKSRVHQWILFGLILFADCSKKNSAPDPPVIPGSSHFAKGADISWVTEMEASGKKFYNTSGAAMDCFDLLQSLGINSIRLRAWVNPADGWCSTSDLVAKAKRAKAQSVRQLLAELAYEGSFFAVAINQTVVPRRDWDQSVLKDGDKIEIVSPRQGG